MAMKYVSEENTWRRNYINKMWRKTEEESEENEGICAYQKLWEIYDEERWKKKKKTL